MPKLMKRRSLVESFNDAIEVCSMLLDQKGT